MRKLGILLASAIALAAVASPAEAVRVTFTEGASGLVNNGQILENFDSYKAGSTMPALAVTTGVNKAGASYLSGYEASYRTKVYDSTVPGEGVDPSVASNNYASILGGGSYTLVLAKPAPVVSFLVGSLDAYNSVVLSLTNNTFATFTGSQLGTLGEDGRVVFDTGSGTTLIDAIRFSSGSNSMEIDNIASAAPEAATWMMMILGFGIVGGALRSRRQATLVAA